MLEAAHGGCPYEPIATEGLRGSGVHDTPGAVERRASIAARALRPCQSRMRDSRRCSITPLTRGRLRRFPGESA